MDVADIRVKFGADTSDLDRGISSANKSVNGFAQSASKSLNSFGSSAMAAGGILTAGLTLPIVGIGTAAIAAGTKLNAAMANIGSMGIATARVNELKTAIQNVAIQTGKSTDDLAKGTYQIISAYGDSANTAKILEINTKVAAAGVASLSDTVGAIAIVTKNWGDTSTEAQSHVGDLLLKTVALGQTTLPELASSLGGVAPAAHAAGLSTQELFATVATAAGVTGNTSQAITQMNGVIAAFAKPSTDMNVLLKANGFASGEAAIKALGFQGAMQMVYDAHVKTGTALASYTKRIEGARLIQALATTSAQTYNDNLKQLGNVAGTTDMAFDAQTKGVNAAGFAMEQAKAKMEVFFQRINDGMGPALLAFTSLLSPVVDKLLELSDSFAHADPVTQKWIVGIAAGGAAIGPLLIGVGSLARAIAFFLPFAASLSSVLFGLAIPLSLLYAAYKLNLFGLHDLVTNGIQRLRNAVPFAGDALHELVAQLTGVGINSHDTTEGIQHFVSALTGSESTGISAGNWVSALGDKLYASRTAFTAAGGGAQGFVAALTTFTGIDLPQKLSEAKAAISGIGTTLSDVFSGKISFSQFVSGLSAALSGIPAMLSTLFSGVDFTAIKTKIVTALGLDNVTFDFTTIKGKVSDAISKALSSVDWSAITADFKSLPAWVSEKLALIDWSTITTTFSSLKSWASDKLGAIDWSSITTDFSSLKTWVSDKLGKLDFSTITGTFSGITTIVSNFDASLKGLTSADGGITKLQAMFLTGLKSFSDTLAGIDPNKTASVALSFSGSVKSVLDMFTTLSGLGGIEVTTETKAISDITKSILGLATSFTNGLDAQGIADSASKFATSYVDKLTNALKVSDLPGIADAASNLVKAISGKFKDALSSTGSTEIGQSLGGLSNEIVKQIGAVLNDKKIAAELGSSFANILTGITQGLSNVLAGFNSKTLGDAQSTQLQSGITAFVANFLSGISAGFAQADYGSVIASFVGNLFKGILQGNGILQDFQAISENGAGFANVSKLIKDLALLGNIPGQLGDKLGASLTGGAAGEQTREDARIARGDAARNAASANLANLQSTPIPNPLPVSVVGAITTTAALGTANDFSTMMASLNTLAAKNTNPSGVMPVKIDSPVAITASVPLPVSMPYSASDNSIRTANDFSSALSELSALSAKASATPPFTWPPYDPMPPVKVDPIPPVTVPTIPPVQVNPIPPVQVPQPTWLNSLLSWHPSINIGMGSALTGDLPAHATGTKFAPGGWSWIGENGPELMRVPRGAQIMSNQNSMDAIGQLAAGNYQGGPYLGNPALPMPPIGPQLAPMVKHLAGIEKSSNLTAINSKLTANQAVRAPLNDAQRLIAMQRAAAAQQGIPANAAMTKTAAAVQKVGEEIAKNFKGTVDEFKSALQGIPGLFHTSPVTQQQMDLAKAGVPQNFADDWIRRLTDSVVNGVHWDGVDIQDAAKRAGLDPTLPAKTILQMVTDSWNDQSFFAGGKNTDLINMDAIKASLAKQQASASGKDALMALFGIQPDQVQQQALAAGQQAKTSLQQGFTGLGAGKAGVAAAPQVDLMSMLLGNSATVTPESVAPFAASFMSAISSAFSGTKDKDGKKTGIDFGSIIATAITTSLSDSETLAGAGQAILQKIADSWNDSKTATVDMAGKLSAAFNTNLGLDSSISALADIGGKIFQLVLKGYTDAAAKANIVAPIAASLPSTPAIGANANGTDNWRGGLTWVGERGKELIDLPRGSQVHSNSDSMAMAGASASSNDGSGDTHYHMHATIVDRIDEEAMFRRFAKRMERKRG